MSNEERLKNYPYKINGTQIPFPKMFDDSIEVIENVNQSETGKDIIQVKRIGKRNFAYTYRLLSDWVPIFEAWANSSTALTVGFYSIQESGYEYKMMRMRNFKKSLVKNSEDLYGIAGIWDISFTLIEF